MPPADVALLLAIPTSWTRLISKVRGVCPSAVIAGGALRDLDNGAPVKDLDIFISAHAAQLVDEAVTSLMARGFVVHRDDSFEGGKAYPEDQNLEVIQIADLLETGLDIPVQLIFVNWDTADIVNRFDYGICRLSWDGETLTRPPEYDEDKAAKVFRLRRDRPTPVSMRGSIRRYARLTAEKYPGWDWAAYENPSAWHWPI